MSPPAPSQCRVIGCTYETKDNLPSHQAVHDALQLHVQTVHILPNRQASLDTQIRALNQISQGCSPLPSKQSAVPCIPNPPAPPSTASDASCKAVPTSGVLCQAAQQGLGDSLCQILGDPPEEPSEDDVHQQAPSTSLYHNRTNDLLCGNVRIDTKLTDSELFMEHKEEELGKFVSAEEKEVMYGAEKVLAKVKKDEEVVDMQPKPPDRMLVNIKVEEVVYFDPGPAQTQWRGHFLSKLLAQSPALPLPPLLLNISPWERLIWRSGLLYRNNPRVSSHLPSTSSPSESADFAIGVGSTSQVTVSSVFDTVIDHLCRGKTSFERSSLSAICPFLLLFPLLWRRRYAVRAPTSLLFPLQWHRRYESPLPLFPPSMAEAVRVARGLQQV